MKIRLNSSLEKIANYANFFSGIIISMIVGLILYNIVQPNIFGFYVDTSPLISNILSSPFLYVVFSLYFLKFILLRNKSKTIVVALLFLVSLYLSNNYLETTKGSMRELIINITMPKTVDSSKLQFNDFLFNYGDIFYLAGRIDVHKDIALQDIKVEVFYDTQPAIVYYSSDILGVEDTPHSKIYYDNHSIHFDPEECWFSKLDYPAKIKYSIYLNGVLSEYTTKHKVFVDRDFYNCDFECFNAPFQITDYLTEGVQYCWSRLRIGDFTLPFSKEPVFNEYSFKTISSQDLLINLKEKDNIFDKFLLPIIIAIISVLIAGSIDFTAKKSSKIVETKLVKIIKILIFVLLYVLIKDYLPSTVYWTMGVMISLFFFYNKSKLNRIFSILAGLVFVVVFFLLAKKLFPFVIDVGWAKLTLPIQPIDIGKYNFWVKVYFFFTLLISTAIFLLKKKK